MVNLLFKVFSYCRVFYILLLYCSVFPELDDGSDAVLQQMAASEAVSRREQIKYLENQVCYSITNLHPYISECLNDILLP